MAYQNVGTPRFFVDHGLWLYTLGVHTPPDDKISFVQLNPSNIQPRGSGHLTVRRLSPINYIAFLGTSTSSIGYYPDWWDGTSDHPIDGFTEIINCNGYNQNPEQYIGFSMATFTDDPSYTYARGIMASTAKCGSISIGSTYTMPNAPNLSLTMSRDYGGINEFTTYNGSSMSNAMWSKAPKWGDLGAWELGGGDPRLSRSGRRGWDLKFSYMDDGDLWGPNQMLEQEIGDAVDTTLYDGGTSGDLGSNTYFTYNLLADENFFSQVWHKTLGGTLPFIFQADSSHNNPDQFAICKFKDNSLKATQSAFNVYDISLSIEEVW